MMNYKLLLPTLLALFALTGCISSGVQSLEDETHATLDAKIKSGETTKSQLFDMLGAPTNTTFTDGGLEVVSYEFTRLTPKARNFIPYNILSQVEDGVKKELVVLLADNNTVQKFVLNEAQIQVRAGVLE